MGDTNMPSYDALASKKYSPREWLNYYRNIWVRNNVARTIDVMTDVALKAQDPEQMVNCEDEGVRPVKARLEIRKKAVQDGLGLVKAIDELLAIPEGEFSDKVWGDAFLSVAEDMKPKPAPVAAPAPVAEPAKEAAAVAEPEKPVEAPATAPAVDEPKA